MAFCTGTSWAVTTRPTSVRASPRERPCISSVALADGIAHKAPKASTIAAMAVSLFIPYTPWRKFLI